MTVRMKVGSMYATEAGIVVLVERKHTYNRSKYICQIMAWPGNAESIGHREPWLSHGKRYGHNHLSVMDLVREIKP